MPAWIEVPETHLDAAACSQAAEAETGQAAWRRAAHGKLAQPDLPPTRLPILRPRVPPQPGLVHACWGSEGGWLPAGEELPLIYYFRISWCWAQNLCGLLEELLDGSGAGGREGGSEKMALRGESVAVALWDLLDEPVSTEHSELATDAC